MCAAQAGQMGRRVAVLDHADAPGKKILISGGGRCNFTNTGTTAARFLSANPHFAKSALARFTPSDFVALVERYGIAWHEKTLGQLFCDGSAKQIVAMLMEECALGGVDIRMGEAISDISHGGNGFQVVTSAGTYQAPCLVIATGGPSIPKLGATGFAYEIARQFGHKVVEPRPALVPFKLSGDEALFRELTGVATDTRVSCNGISFREASLFTHKGLSGPAMLQVSSYWRHGDAIVVDFLPEEASEDWLLQAKHSKPRGTLDATLTQAMPARLAEMLSEKLGVDRPLGEMADKRLEQVAAQLRNWGFTPSGTEGYAKAEVTVGGVSTEHLSSRSMESKKLPGLYFIGEAVDVTGWLGGYNFQWAWASGVAAAEAIAWK